MSEKTVNEPTLKSGDIAYSTRHALTKGIVKVTVVGITNGDWLNVRGVWYGGRQGTDFHATIGAAQDKAREMAQRAIKNLDKKRASLEAIVKDGAKIK